LLRDLADNPGLIEAGDTLRITHLVAAWVRSPHAFPDGLSPIDAPGRLVWHVRHALQHGLLDADDDRGALVRFMRLARMVPAPA